MVTLSLSIMRKIPSNYSWLKQVSFLDRKKEPAKMSSYEVRCPSHTEDVARILLDLLRQGPPGGILQWCGREKLSKGSPHCRKI